MVIVFSFFFPPPPAIKPRVLTFILKNAQLIALFGFLVQIIEALYFYNRFINKQLTVIMEQQISLKRSRAELSRLNQSKDRFFAIISHDIKNPFTALLSMSQALADNHTSLSKEEINFGIRKINEATVKIYKLLENMLLWANSQLGNMAFNPQWINFREITHSVIEVFQSALNDKNLELDVNYKENNEIFADRQMITAVLRNLISNSIKFSKPGTTISIYLENRADHSHIRLKDEGKGMTEEDVKKLFRIDVKNKSIGDGKNKGTGLGLIICKEFIDHHRGEIKVESSPGKGSTFIIRIPLPSKEKQVDQLYSEESLTDKSDSI